MLLYLNRFIKKLGLPFLLGIFSSLVLFKSEPIFAKPKINLSLKKNKNGLELPRLPDVEHINYGIIQNRKYSTSQEILLGGVWLPNDPYTKPLVLQAGYTAFFNNHFGWNIASLKYFVYINSLERQFRKSIVARISSAAAIGNPAADTSQLVFPEIQQALSSKLVIKPIYGKFNWLNRKNIRLETQFEIGPSILRINRVSNAGGPLSFNIVDSSFNLGAEVGFKVRWWAKEHWSFLLGVTNLVYYGPKPGAVINRSLKNAPLLTLTGAYSKPFKKIKYKPIKDKSKSKAFRKASKRRSK